MVVGARTVTSRLALCGGGTYMTWYETPPSPPPPIVNCLPPGPRRDESALCMCSSQRREMYSSSVSSFFGGGGGGFGFGSPGRVRRFGWSPTGSPSSVLRQTCRQIDIGQREGKGRMQWPAWGGRERDRRTTGCSLRWRPRVGGASASPSGKHTSPGSCTGSLPTPAHTGEESQKEGTQLRVARQCTVPKGRAGRARGARDDMTRRGEAASSSALTMKGAV
jgi:hypothetical protein